MRVFVFLCLCWFAGLVSAGSSQGNDLKTKGQNSLLTPSDVAVIVNKNDPNSLEVGQYYLNARQIPAENLITVSLPAHQAGIDEAELAKLKSELDSKLKAHIKVLALMWTTPYAVRCNSITSALTLGFDAEQCKNTCNLSNKNPYFSSASLNPKQDHDMRLAMLMPTDDVALAKALIDRAVLSSFTLPQSTGYFLRTHDDARSKPREPFFPKDLFKVESKKIVFRNLKQDFIEHKKDIMFYFTGTASVPRLETLNFMPGAVADHLTSFGGVLTGQGQMPATNWIKAGATGSYGTVSEPCNYWQKFPNPTVLVKFYLSGNTLVEAYWKSVYAPSQGIFVGEPLAAPFKTMLSE